jgi:hypothetical protein
MRQHWSIGVVEYWSDAINPIPQHSNTPILQHLAGM